MVNARQKGASGEREIADDLNYIVYKTMKELEHPSPTISSIQRNQNQSAVGGADLTNTFGCAIEVKRQENLNVGAWWRQCVASAQRNAEIPVLLYRQNKGKWSCMMPISVALPGVDGRAALAGAFMEMVGEVDYDSFKQWFTERVRRMLLNGHEVKV